MHYTFPNYNFCQKKALIEYLGFHKMLNIDFIGTHVFKCLFSIQLSLKIAQVEVSQTILKILCI